MADDGGSSDPMSPPWSDRRAGGPFRSGAAPFPVQDHALVPSATLPRLRAATAEEGSGVRESPRSVGTRMRSGVLALADFVDAAFGDGAAALPGRWPPPPAQAPGEMSGEVSGEVANRVLTMPPDGDIARTAPLRARVSNRLARHIRTAPVMLAAETPLVSLTFDDAPMSACIAGAELLGAYGAKGTYYIAGGLIGSRAIHWQVADEASIARLHLAGHEIGCHTHSHVFLPDLDPGTIAAEARRNAERLRRIVPELLIESFAFPYGFGSLTAKRALGAVYRSSRSIAPGLNVGRADAQFLHAFPLIEGRVDADGIARVMDDALARNGWLIFYGHDVAARPSAYGCSPALLETVLRAAAARNIPCLGVAEALRRATA